MKDNDVEGYLTRQMGLTPAQWDEIARGIQHGAKSARLYFHALVAEGFTRDAALKILCAHGCSPKWPWDSTTTRSDEDD
jgi:hypothetical protein